MREIIENSLNDDVSWKKSFSILSFEHFLNENEEENTYFENEEHSDDEDES